MWAQRLDVQLHGTYVKTNGIILKLFIKSLS